MPSLDEILKTLDDYTSRLLAKFKYERFAYLAVAICFAILAIVVIIIGLCSDNVNYVEIGAMFGSSGIVALACQRVLRMWDDVRNDTKDFWRELVKDENE